MAGSPNGTTSMTYCRPTRQIANNSNTITAYALLRDAYNNPIANQSASFTASGSNTAVTANGNTNSLGVATATYRTSTAQNENALVSMGGLSLIQPLIFTLAPAACSLTVAPTSVIADGNSIMQLSATVTDASNTPLGNVLVSFLSTGSATRFAPSSAITTTQGTASIGVTSFLAGPNKFIAQTSGIQCTAQGNFTTRAAYCSGTPTYTKTTINVGTNPVDMLATDLNNDGVADLAAVNYVSNTLTTIISNGDGSFRNPVSYAAGASSYHLAAGDLDADGSIDIAVANYAANTIYIYLGSPTGSLSLYSSLPTSSKPQAIAISDIDADGALDILVNNLGASTLGVYLG
ncbi:MAG: hypothetical protein EOO61_21925, partial [Hymenobacter sp.]